MDKYPLLRKSLAVGIILLFVGTGIIPSTAQNIEYTCWTKTRITLLSPHFI